MVGVFSSTDHRKLGHLTTQIKDYLTKLAPSIDPGDEFAAKSPMISDYKDVWQIIMNLTEGDSVSFTGILFQDMYHKKSGKHRTRNFAEIHPILKAVKL